MNFKIVFSLFFAGSVFFSCNNEAQSENEISKNNNTKEETVEVKEFSSPCEVFTLNDTKSFFSIPETVEIKLKDKVLTYPTCVYKWKTGDFIETVKVGQSTISYEAESELLIVMVKDAKQYMYDAAVESYGNNIQNLKIGDASIWSDKRSQVSFLYKSYMFHVYVKAFNNIEENKAKAIEVSEKIISRL